MVYAVLWWARGFLVFLILRKFLPRSLSICYSAGALVVLHASDAALGWIGQMNQFGFIFWMVFAFYLLTSGAESANWALASLFAIAAGLCEYMSLWSYESQLPLLLVLPLCLLLRWRSWRKLAFLYGAWYSILAIYIRLTILRYPNSAGHHTYQELVMRKDWSWRSLLADWLFNITASLEFWNWPRGDWKAPKSEAYLLALIAALVFIACGLAFMRLTRENRRPNPFVESIWTWWTLLAVGFILVVLSFPVYLLLDSARGLWRTQFLSGIGASLVLAALAGLISHAFARQTAKIALFLTFGALVAFFGSASAIQKCARHRWIWERHRVAIKEILQVAPNVQPGAVIVLANVPKDNDPFGHDMWLDFASAVSVSRHSGSGSLFLRRRHAWPGRWLEGWGKLMDAGWCGLSTVLPGYQSCQHSGCRLRAIGPGKTRGRVAGFRVRDALRDRTIPSGIRHYRADLTDRQPPLPAGLGVRDAARRTPAPGTRLQPLPHLCPAASSSPARCHAA